MRLDETSTAGHHKPEIIPRKLDEDKQRAFIAAYEKLLNSLPDNEAASTIRLLESIQMAWPMLAFIHVYLDNTRYHHAKLVRQWLPRPGWRNARIPARKGIPKLA